MTPAERIHELGYSYDELVHLLAMAWAEIDDLHHLRDAAEERAERAEQFAIHYLTRGTHT